MRRPFAKRKCQHRQTFFDPDPRSDTRQRYCAKPAWRQASKAASQRRWFQKPGNRDYFTGPTQVERVRQWRQSPPGPLATPACSGTAYVTRCLLPTTHYRCWAYTFDNQVACTIHCAGMSVRIALASQSVGVVRAAATRQEPHRLPTAGGSQGTHVAPHRHRRQRPGPRGLSCALLAARGTVN